MYKGSKMFKYDTLTYKAYGFNDKQQVKKTATTRLVHSSLMCLFGPGT